MGKTTEGGVIAWWKRRRLNKLRRELAGVEAEIQLERQYLPTIYPNVMAPLVRRRAEILWELGDKA